MNEQLQNDPKHMWSNLKHLWSWLLNGHESASKPFNSVASLKAIQLHHTGVTINVSTSFVVLWVSHRSLGAIGIRQWHGQSLKVSTTGAHPGEGVGTSNVGVTAPWGAQDSPGLWNVRVSCGRRDTRRDSQGWRTGEIRLFKLCDHGQSDVWSLMSTATRAAHGAF